MTSPAARPEKHVKQLIAANLDRAIRESRKTNRQIGEAVGTTEHAVWRWRRGQTEPSPRYATALAAILFDGDLSQLFAPIPDRKAA